MVYMLAERTTKEVSEDLRREYQLPEQCRVVRQHQLCSTRWMI